ncbi:Uma2 family endonuclease [Prosthecomicrobium sp. N25]|uniref:Uma2 family endonuclease n=1 Tax=Prosthecomicrobium sp. N25 TaxID=3129254 RepID=UPI003076B961
MAEREPQRMTLDAFLAWERDQEDRYELVDGRPMAMTGGTQAHDLVRGNIFAALKERLRGKPCRAYIDVKLVCPSGNSRYPDVQVDCAPVDRDAVTSRSPALVVEVLSRSTMATDVLVKHGDYQSVPSIETCVVFWQDRPKAVLHRRIGSHLVRAEDVEGLDAAVAVPGLDLNLPLSVVYDGVPLDASR